MGANLAMIELKFWIRSFGVSSCFLLPSYLYVIKYGLQISCVGPSPGTENLMYTTHK